MYLTNKVSQIFAKFANYEFLAPIQNFVNNAYVNLLGLDMSDFKDPKEYKCLNALFTRELVKKRKFDKSNDTFISPADSFITVATKCEKNKAFQIKGISYTLEKLLSFIELENIKKLYDSEYVNFYLSPKDYHRYHMPYTAKIKKAVYIPGKLIPVNIPALKFYDELFTENERVVIECEVTDKLFYMVFVGALNVGKMRFFFDEKIQTNANKNKIEIYEYSDLEIAKGECLGYFEMGSTILLFWEKNFIKLVDLNNKKIKFGDIIAYKK